MLIPNVMNRFSLAVLLLAMLALGGCAKDRVNTYSEEASKLEAKKIETPVLESTTFGFNSLTLFTDGSERTGRIKAPYEDAWNFAGKVLDKGPKALLYWFGFDYLKKDSDNDAATAQSRPPVVRPEVISPEVVEPTIVEVPSAPAE